MRWNQNERKTCLIILFTMSLKYTRMWKQNDMICIVFVFILCFYIILCTTLLECRIGILAISLLYVVFFFWFNIFLLYFLAIAVDGWCAVVILNEFCEKFFKCKCAHVVIFPIKFLFCLLFIYFVSKLYYHRSSKPNCL